jgi:chromosome segregation ATPase
MEENKSKTRFSCIDILDNVSNDRLTEKLKERGYFVYEDDMEAALKESDSEVNSLEKDIDDLKDEEKEYQSTIEVLESEIECLKEEIDRLENGKSTVTIYDQLCDIVGVNRHTSEEDLIGKFSWLICNPRSRVDFEKL